jgi:hypothetical protein
MISDGLIGIIVTDRMCVRCGKSENDHADDHEILLVWHCSICDIDGHSAAETHCSMCSVHPAIHKIGEEGFGFMNFHNLTARLCCDHFQAIVGDCTRWPTYGHRKEWPEYFEEHPFTR